MNLEKEQEEIKKQFKYQPDGRYEHVMLSFFTIEREYYEKGTAWFVVATILGIISIIYFLIDGAFTSAIVFVLILTTLYLFGNEPPRKMEVHITHKGIYLNRRFYHFKDINSYWIINDPEHDVHAMYFDIGKAVIRTYSIQLLDIPDKAVRIAINKNIEEDVDKEEPGHSKVCRFLKL